ncbi:MAG: maleylpyruvate isomerase family mycothiol-dependent enzyme, partial [Actinomycetota bacterium]
PYPARLQAFHVANHLALHADDIGVPVEPSAVAGRRSWRLAVCLFGLSEAGWPVVVDRVPDANRVVLEEEACVLPDDELVDVVTGRLPEGHPCPASIRGAAAVMA